MREERCGATISVARSIRTGQVRDHIFISYRRDDARGASGRLFDWLRIGFGHERVFRDVHSIGVGKWREKIDAALARSAVLVAVIGPRWADSNNLARLSDSGDMVRHEIISALASDGITIVPTLVEGATVPARESLPEEVRPLFSVWNAREVTENGWEDDTRRLIHEIAHASKLKVKASLDSFLESFGALASKIAAAESDHSLPAEQIDLLRGKVAVLTERLAEAREGRERENLAVAFDALARSDVLSAYGMLERII